MPALAALYANCARTLGPGCYTPEQVAAWASFGADLAGFADYVLKADTGVAVAEARFAVDPLHGNPDGATPLGFSGIDDSGEVKSLYVHPDMMRRGLAVQLLAHGWDVRRRVDFNALPSGPRPFACRCSSVPVLPWWIGCRRSSRGRCSSGFGWQGVRRQWELQALLSCLHQAR